MKSGKENTYIKYLNPDDFNVLAQARFEGWKDLCLQIMEPYIGRHFSEEAFEKSMSPIVLERSRNPGEMKITTRVIHRDFYAMSSVYMEEGKAPFYVRFENFMLTVADIKTKSNLTSLYFSIKGELPVLLNLWKNNYDIMSFFIDELKMAYNAPTNHWAMHIDLEEKGANLKKLSHYILDKDEKMESRAPIHLNNFMLEL